MRRASAAFACLLLFGCASASGTMLSENVAIISAEGNAHRDGETIVQNALAEAARLTRAYGYRYFVILTADNLTHTTTLRVPGRTYHDQFTSRWTGALPNAGAISGGLLTETYTTPDRTEERIWPTLEIMIRMYREGEIEPSMGNVFDAAE